MLCLLETVVVVTDGRMVVITSWTCNHYLGFLFAIDLSAVAQQHRLSNMWSGVQVGPHAANSVN